MFSRAAWEKSVSVSVCTCVCVCVCVCVKLCSSSKFIVRLLRDDKGQKTDQSDNVPICVDHIETEVCSQLADNVWQREQSHSYSSSTQRDSPKTREICSRMILRCLTLSDSETDASVDLMRD